MISPDVASLFNSISSSQTVQETLGICVPIHFPFFDSPSRIVTPAQLGQSTLSPDLAPLDTGISISHTGQKTICSISYHLYVLKIFLFKDRVIVTPFHDPSHVQFHPR